MRCMYDNVLMSTYDSDPSAREEEVPRLQCDSSNASPCPMRGDILQDWNACRAELEAVSTNLASRLRTLPLLADACNVHADGRM